MDCNHNKVNSFSTTIDFTFKVDVSAGSRHDDNVATSEKDQFYSDLKAHTV